MSFLCTICKISNITTLHICSDAGTKDLDLSHACCELHRHPGSEPCSSLSDIPCRTIRRQCYHLWPCRVNVPCLSASGRTVAWKMVRYIWAEKGPVPEPGRHLYFLGHFSGSYAHSRYQDSRCEVWHAGKFCPHPAPAAYFYSQGL